MQDLKIVVRNVLLGTVSAIKESGAVYFLLFFLLAALREGVELFFAHVVGAGWALVDMLASVLLDILLYSIVAYVIQNIATTNRHHLKNIGSGLAAHVYNIMNIIFLFYVLRIVLTQLMMFLMLNEATIDFIGITHIIEFVIRYFLLSAWFETCAIGRKGGIDALRSALAFYGKNFFSWTILNLPFWASIYYLLYTPQFVRFAPSRILTTLLAYICMALMLIVRGKAYYYLQESNPRKRKFESEMRA